MTQYTFDDFNEAETGEETPDEEPEVIPRGFPTAAPNAVLTDSSCPWCLAPSEEFNIKTSDDIEIGSLIRDPQVSCDHCDAVIPTEAEWYQNGEKICLQ